MLKLTAHTLVATIALLYSHVVLAFDPGVYSDQELREAKHVYEPNIRGIFREDLIQRLSREQRYSLSDVNLEMPLRGEHPLQFSARPEDRTVVVPVLSVKFLDDLTIAWAWFEEQGCETAYLTSYLSSLLRFHEIDQEPLEAFGIPYSIIQNERVNSLALKLHKTAIYFLLAHEVGHLIYGHVPILGGQASQRQEEEADDFALDAMARIGVMPAGMILWFIAGYMFEPLPDLKTWELDAGVIGELTHPLGSVRVRTIANRLASDPMDYAHSEEDPRRASQGVVYAAKQMAEIADQIDNGGIRIYSAGWLIEHFPPRKFRSACPAN